MPFLGKTPGVSTVTVTDDAITTAKIADNAITSAKIGVDVIVAEDLAANSVTVSEITDGVITEAKLNIDNTPTNDYVLTAKSSAAGGLTWAAAAAVAGITSSADATAMTIDSSERIVMPSQPMFSAHTINDVSGGGSLAEASSYVYNSSGATSGTIRAVTFGKILINIGSHWNNTTGQFTCPIAGRYLAFWNNNYHGMGSWPNSYIMHSVSGGTTSVVANSWQSHTQVSSNYSNLVSFAIVECAANDLLWPGYHTSYDAPSITTTWGYNQCAFMLLG